MCQKSRCLKTVLSVRPNTKRTALHIAARFGNAECIPILVRFGAYIETEDKDGKTALELAVWKKHCLAAQELEKLGANKKGLAASKCFKGIEISVSVLDANYMISIENFHFNFDFIYLDHSKNSEENHVQINLIDKKENDPVYIAEKNRESRPILEVDDRNMLITDEGNIQGSKVFSIIETYTNSSFLNSF